MIDREILSFPYRSQRATHIWVQTADGRLTVHEDHITSARQNRKSVLTDFNRPSNSILLMNDRDVIEESDARDATSIPLATTITGTAVLGSDADH
jgi:hypothetical protein